jgi:hypothetical protein
MTTPEWRSEVRLLVAHPAGRSILRPAGAVALPVLTLPGRVWSDEPAPVAAAARAAYGLDVTVLFTVRDEVDEAAATVAVAVVCEVAAPPPGWVDADDRLDPDAALIRTALDRLAAGPGAAPWTAPGWHAEAGGWLRAAVGLPPGPVEQVRTWSLSAVLRTATPTGYVYLKVSAARPLFADEPRVTAALAARFPGRVPAPLAVDPGRRRLATADFGEPLGWETPKENRLGLVRDFARLQIDSVGAVEDLLAAGGVDRRDGRHDAWLTGPDTRRHLPADEYDRLQAWLPALPGRRAELASYGLPDTLLHGDMHPGNAARTESGHLFFDWTDAAAGHPFLDMFLLLREEDPEFAPVLCAAYLGEWEAFAGRDLAGAWAAARPLVAAHHAISYVSLTANHEPRDADMDGGAAEFLRLVISTLDGQR